MKKLLHIILLLFAVSEGNSQVNLVPNFSFEEYAECPLNDGNLYFANGWSLFSASNTSPDYYNICAPPNGFNVPQSIFCYQQDNRDCGAYIGVLTFETSGGQSKEHIGIQMIDTLIVGQKYYISFYTVMGEYRSNSSGSQYGMPSNNIGIKLSTIPYSSNNPTPIDNFAHLHSETVITDSINWSRISGSIIADSAYNYLVIGNFYSNENTDTTNYNCSNCFNSGSYYLVDDVCVSTDSLLCNGGIELLPCIVSVEENNLKNRINIYPNPASDYITINTENQQSPFDITIYNTMGQKLYHEKNIHNSNQKIDVSQYNTNLLIIKIEFNNQLYNFKLLKN